MDIFVFTMYHTRYLNNAVGVNRLPNWVYLTFNSNVLGSILLIILRPIAYSI